MIPTQQPPPPVFRLTPDGYERVSTGLHPARLQPRGPPPATLPRPYNDIPVVDVHDLEFPRPKPAYVTSYESACQHGPLSVVEFTIQTKRRTPAFLHHGLLLALQAGNLETTRYLLSAGAPIARHTPFQIVNSAPTPQQIPLFELFHHHGWTPNTIGYDGDILLPHVVTNLPLLRWFLSHGADPNLGRSRPDRNRNRNRNRVGDCDPNSCDALERAAAHADVEAVRSLLDAGANIQNGFPLHHAAGVCPPNTLRFYSTVVPSAEFDTARIPVMELLVARGADVNQYFESRYMEPRYAIVQSVLAGAVERTRWLLQHGANPEIGGVGNALRYARAVGSDEMKKVLEERGYIVDPIPSTVPT